MVRGRAGGSCAADVRPVSGRRVRRERRRRCADDVDRPDHDASHRAERQHRVVRVHGAGRAAARHAEELGLVRSPRRVLCHGHRRSGRLNPRAVVQQIRMLRGGNGPNVELFQYTSPDQDQTFRFRPPHPAPAAARADATRRQERAGPLRTRLRTRGSQGIYWANHTWFFWREQGTQYAASLHYFGRGTTTLLARLIRDLRPGGHASISLRGRIPFRGRNHPRDTRHGTPCRRRLRSRTRW
jgi:hypothetical protein